MSSSSSSLSFPTIEELRKSLVDDGFEYENEPVLIFNSNTASYYNCTVKKYGEATLKICLTSNTTEINSFKGSSDLYHHQNALSVVVEPKLYFEFGADKICYIYAQFTPFILKTSSATSAGSLTKKQMINLKEIMGCMRFLVDKGLSHGRIGDESVCGVVLCHGKGMLTDLKFGGWPRRTTECDYKDLGKYLGSVAKSSWRSSNIPKDLQFLITQLANVTFSDGTSYGHFDEHPFFYSSRRKLVLYMFGSVEGEIYTALKAKAAAAGTTRPRGQSPTTFSQNRSNERNAFEQKLKHNLTLLNSYPAPVTTTPSSAGPSSPVTSLPPATSQPRSPVTSLPPAQSSTTQTGSPSTPPTPRMSVSSSIDKFCWKDVCEIHSDIKTVHHIGVRLRNVMYNYNDVVDYLRFVRNVYAHVLAQSQLNENGREALFQEVDKMWPGFVFALFATLANMKLLLNV